MKKLFLLLTALLLVLGLSACHGSTKERSFVVPDNFDDSRDYNITFWAKNDTNKTQIAVYNQAVKDFEELYPNIHVTITFYTDYARIYNDVITNISTDTTPNVCITYPDHIATYITGADTVADLDDLMVNEKYGLGGSDLRYDGPKKDEVVSEYLNEGIIKDHYYALPFMRSTEALYINKDFVEELGYEVPDVLTWDFIFEVSEKATEKNPDGSYKINGQMVMIPFIYKSTDNMMISMLKQLEAPYSNDDGEILIFNDTTKDILLNISEHVGSGAFSTFKISSYPANYLNAGQCIFAIDSTAGATWMGTKAPQLDIDESQLVDFETIVRPIPQYDVNDIKMISQGPSVCVFNKNDPQEVLASWLFAQYLLTNDVQIAYSKTEGYSPVTLKAANDDVYKDYLANDDNEHYDIKIKATKLLMDNVDNTFVTSVFNGSASLRTAAGQMIEEVTKGVRRGKSVDSAFIDSLYSDMNNLYRLDQVGGDLSQKEFGPLPTGSIVLLVTLAFAWILIGIYYLQNFYKRKAKN